MSQDFDTPDTPPEDPSDKSTQGEPSLPVYIIEGARSSRSRCKTCRRKIDKGSLRIGMLVEGPYGPGHMWHHLRCAARSHFDKLAEAYEMQAWNEAKEPPSKLPAIDDLAKLKQDSEKRKKERRELPYLELDPSGRAKCKHCAEPMAKGEMRAVLARAVYFGSQVRRTPINVHVRCAAAELDASDCETEREGLEELLRANSRDVDEAQLESAIREITGS